MIACEPGAQGCHQMCSLTIECVPFDGGQQAHLARKMLECVLLQQNVFSYNRMCSLTIECVLLQVTVKQHDGKEDTIGEQNVFSYNRMCSLTTECVLLQVTVKQHEGKEDTIGERIAISEVMPYASYLIPNT